MVHGERQIGHSRRWWGVVTIFSRQVLHTTTWLHGLRQISRGLAKQTRYLGFDDLITMRFLPMNQALAAFIISIKAAQPLPESTASSSNVPSGVNNTPPPPDISDASDAEWEIV